MVMVRNRNEGASFTAPDGTEYTWGPNDDVTVPEAVADQLIAFRDGGFVATQDADRDDSDDLVTVNELRREAGEEPVEGGDRVKRPRRPRKDKPTTVVVPQREFTEVDPVAAKASRLAEEVFEDLTADQDLA